MLKFVASKRTQQGTGASRRLRNAGQVPGIVYGGEGQPELIQMDHNALWQAIQKEAFHSTILDMDLDGGSSQVLLRDLQIHPYRKQILHADFQRVLATEEIHMYVPLHYVGEEESKAVKVDNCLIDKILTEIEVRCLPANLPERIEVDLSHLEQGSTITLDEVKMPEGVKIALRGRNAEDIVLVSVVLPVEEEEAEVAATPEVAAGAAPAEGAAADGAAPAAEAAKDGDAAKEEKGKK